MSRTVIYLDDEALKAAARELGTTTKRDTVNTALREIAARNRRARAWAELQQLTADGGLDLDLLADKDLLIAATAELSGLTLLHYDKDFQTVARSTDQPHAFVSPLGAVD